MSIRKRALPANGIFACNGIREQDWIAIARHAGFLTSAQPGRRGAAAGARLSPVDDGPAIWTAKRRLAVFPPRGDDPQAWLDGGWPVLTCVVPVGQDECVLP